MFFLLLFEVEAARGLLVDRVAGSVDGEILLYSDVEIERVLMISEGDDREIVWNLIDRRLLLREADKFKVIENDEDMRKIQQRLEDIKGLLGEEQFHTVLKVYSLAESDILKRLKEKVIADKFTDFRINFFIVISNDSIKAYYNEHMDEYQEMTLDDANKQIGSLLFKEESKSRLDDYMNQLRGKAKIYINL